MNKLSLVIVLVAVSAAMAFHALPQLQPKTLVVSQCSDNFCKQGCKNVSLPLRTCDSGEEIACHINQDQKGRHCVNLTRYNDTKCTIPQAFNNAICGFCYNNSNQFGHILGCEKGKDATEFHYDCNATCGDCKQKVSLATCAISPFDKLAYTIDSVGPCEQVITFRFFKDSDCSGALDHFSLLEGGCVGYNPSPGSAFYQCV